MTGFPPGGGADIINASPHMAQVERSRCRDCQERVPTCVRLPVCALCGAAWELGLLSALQPARCVSARMCAF